MKEHLERVQSAVLGHLDCLCGDVEHDDGFSCHQQLDDMKDCVQILRDVREILSQSLLK